LLSGLIGLKAWDAEASYPSDRPDYSHYILAALGADDCDPNYTGNCVPIASDVDCAGGKGNGPAYVRGPVYVVVSDNYGLDRDMDRVGCK